MISRQVRPPLLALAVGALLLGSAGAAAAAVPDPLPIGPNQVFAGQVNGVADNAPIRTDCLGPITLGETGHPLAGQYVEAVPAPASSATAGYTGSAGQLLQVSLTAPVSSTLSTLIGTLNSYYVQLPVPTSLTVPCSGTGVVAFTPTPGSPTARSATVTVDFLSGP
ncbi:hypothetical protein [Streptacidiphilus sp. P02-A3a]|uniref:hypothetical protein n=1 Tax=Streptacidiphilus sp. P02-A3a TaxID=2704468 RepID=UPI0015F7B0BA|nr:hypothetical protein [Streptacidiphilus sp. P02-A3a]QMU69676.1 hypothetical protein GXP74_16950 [Streptacidiphilus sp. P02-A3a]